MARISITRILVMLSCVSFLYAVFLFFDQQFSSTTFGFDRHASGQLPVTTYRLLPSHIVQYFPLPDPTRKKYHEWNAQTLRELYVCMALSNCGANQQKVALLASHWFEEAIVRDWRGGEGVWGLSVYKNLRELGYTTLFANSFDEALEQYRLFPDLVKVVIRNRAGDCHMDPKCVKGPNNPSGIPAWKIFDFEYFSSPDGRHSGASLMKGKWILSANPDPRFEDGEGPIQYLGFSFEEECSKLPVIPLAERSHQVWMLMKQLTYVYDHRFTWNRSYFSLAAQDLGIDFVGGWKIDQHYQWEPNKKGIMTDIEDKERRVINKGGLNQTAFAHEISTSKMLIGVGNPYWSPSPYNALCQGIPFLNPIINWDRGDPWNKSKWHSQHPSLNLLDPPYVYNVHKENYTGFVEAIKLGSQTEIPRFIPHYMTEKAVQERLIRLLETDWKGHAAILLEERLAAVAAGQDAYTFEL